MKKVNLIHFLLKTAIVRWQFKYKTIMQDSLFVVPSQTFRYLFEDLFIGHHSSAAVADTDSLLDFLSVFPAMVGYLAVWNHNVRFSQM